MAAIGDRIVSTVESMRQRGFTIEQRTRAGDTVYTIIGSAYRLEVTVNPTRWVGLHLDLGSTDHKPTLSYDIDTDLSDLASPRFEALALAVETEIVTFLGHLADGRLQVGRVGRRPALLVPAGKRTLLVTRGRFANATRVRRASSGLESKGGFVALT